MSGDDEFENEERLPVLLIALRIDARDTLLVQARLEVLLIWTTNLASTKSRSAVLSICWLGLG